MCDWRSIPFIDFRKTFHYSGTTISVNDVNSSENFLQCVREAASSAFERAQLAQLSAEEFGEFVAGEVCRNLGGQMLYVPSGHRSNLARRNEEILKKFRGNNHVELAQRFQLCVRSVQLIIKKESSKRQVRSTGAKPAATPRGANCQAWSRSSARLVSRRH